MPDPLLDPSTLEYLRRLRVAAGRVRGAAVRGERQSRTFGAGQEFGAHRPYAQGDDLRRVDWNVYGRLGQLVLKLYEAPGRLRVLLALDDAPTMDFGQANKWLAARRALAAVGVLALAGAEQVLFASFSDRRVLACDAGGESRLLEALGAAQVAPAANPRPAALLESLAVRSRDTVLVTATDFQAREGPLALLRESRRQGGRAAALAVYAREELEPALKGDSCLRPAGGGEVRLRADERALELYRAEVRGYRQAVARAVTATGAALLDLESTDSLQPLLAGLASLGLLEK